MAAPLTVTRTGIIPILQNMQTALVNAGVVPIERCFLVARDPVGTRIERFQGPIEIFIRPLGFLVDQDNVVGAGTLDTRATRSVEITIRTRNDRDQSGQDPHFLLDTDTHITAEESVVNALHMDPSDEVWFDAQGNGLTLCPIRLLSGTEVKRDIEDDLIGWSKLTFEVQYYVPVTLGN